MHNSGEKYVFVVYFVRSLKTLIKKNNFSPPLFCTGHNWAQDAPTWYRIEAPATDYHLDVSSNDNNVYF